MVDKIILAVFLVLGLAALGGFFVKLTAFLKIKGYKGRAKAEIVGIKEEAVRTGKNETETYYSPIVVFKAANVLYRKTFSKMASPVKPRKGEIISIRYDTKDPSLFAKEDMKEEFFQTFGLLVVGVGIFVFIGNVLL